MERTPSDVVKGDVINGWSDLAKLVEFFSRYNLHDWLFRGVPSHEYKLQPKIGRPETRKMKVLERMPYSERDERAIFRQFCDVSTPFIRGAAASEIEWLAIAQHHGMPTRLLDWTESLLVAVWFAIGDYGPGSVTFEGRTSTTKQKIPAIWVARGIPRVKDEERDKPFAINEPRSFRPPHISPRIAAQSSVFTIHGDPTKPLTHEALWQIRITPKRFFELKKRIDACGINERTLFPGLDGIARDMAWRYKNNYLAGYR
jgi:hypothetical protein